MSKTKQPTVTVPASSRFLGVRIPLAQFEELRQAAEKEGKLISEYVRQRIHQVSELEKRIKTLEEDLKREKNVRIFPCSGCGKPILATRENILAAFKEWGHPGCLGEEGS